MKITNSERTSILASDCLVANTFIRRFVGLLGKKCLTPGSGLLIEPCNSIHMFFMKFAIDAIFVDRSNTVLYTISDLKPWRVSKIVPKAHIVLELPAGTIKSSGTQPGDSLNFIQT